MRETLADVLLDRAARFPTHGVAFYGDPAAPPVQRWTWPELVERARARWSALTDKGVRPGDPFIVQRVAPAAFMEDFWACALGGAIPVPLAVARNAEQQAMLARVKARAEAATIPADTGIIQFSSGSSGDPKGIVIGHGQVLANISACASRFEMTPEDRALTWLPLTHDLGLIASHLSMLYAGADQHWLHPLAFLQRPSDWLTLASETRATITAIPNFGVRHVLSRGLADPRRPGWDLSSLRIVVVAADPVSADACARFCDALAPHGFDPAAITPCYGLAEATVAVTLPPPGEGIHAHDVVAQAISVGAAVRPTDGEPGGLTVVECGPAVDGLELRVVDDADAPLPPWTTGHIHVRGTSVTRGYLGVDDGETFAPGGWLRTGDVGFLVPDRPIGDRLVIVGRTKDIVFVGGRNVHLCDVDRVARDAAGRPAVARLDGESLTVLLRHTDRDDEQDLIPRAAAIRKALAGAFGLTAVAVEHTPTLPKTTSGKLRRHALEPGVPIAAPSSQAPPATTVDATLALLLAVLAEVAPTAELGPDTPFMEGGVPSVALAEAAVLLTDRYGLAVTVFDLFAHPTARRLAERLTEPTPAAPPAVAAPGADPGDIAIVGMAAAAAGAPDLETLWQRLLAGWDGVGPLPDARWPDLRTYLAHAPAATASECPPGGYLARIDRFDAAAHGLGDAEARALHPTHRLILDLVADAVADAGLTTAAIRATRAGVYLGHVSDFEGADYQRLIQAVAPDLAGIAVTGNLGAFLAGRLAHSLDLRGPAVVVDTACSASLTAVHTACQALRAGDCDVALAGAARVMVLPFHWPTEMGFESASGRCRSFSADADGMVQGEGGAIVVLKTLAAAERDGDRVYAVIAGSALTHDGGAARLTAPNPRAQSDAYRAAWSRARVAGQDLRFVEAHGAGTRLSDPLEVAALTHALAASAPTDAPARAQPLALGSIKSNIGHLFEAAGVLGLVKAALSVWHRRLPGSLHCDTPNPAIDLAAAGAFVPTAPLDLGDAPLVAGVTSLGLSGTNAHLVLRSPPRRRTARAVERHPRAPERLWVAPQVSAPSGRWDASSAARELRQLIARFGTEEAAEGPDDASFLARGLDSLALIQLRQAVEARFQLAVPLGRLFDDLGTPQRLGAWLAERAGVAPQLDAPRPMRVRGAPRPRIDTSHDPRLAPSEPLIGDLLDRSGASRDLADAARPRLANNRAVASFTADRKPVAFPIAARSARGAWFTDVDGHRTLDLAMGFGVHLFGHDPAFIREAIAAQLDGGWFLGPMHPLAGEVAERLTHLTGTDRVAFYNTGSEAVMVALRCARAVTGRDRVVTFRGSYHGGTDQVLAFAGRDGRSIPLAPGVPASQVADTLVLEYGRPASLDRIWELGDELAAVLVEPVQSRDPGLQPADFLAELRALTRELGVALIFDEVVTGFRLGPVGAQAHFGLRADLVTYGKVLGGGLPIGAVAGQARWMSPIDGGADWRRDDDSLPADLRTFVAGTFCHHPLVMAAARAVLQRLEDAGPALHEALNARTATLVDGLNARFAASGLSLSATRCGSLFRLRAAGAATLFCDEWLVEGVYNWEGRTCFLSTAHTDDDVAFALDAAERALATMARRPAPATPLTPAQAGTFRYARRSDGACLAGLQVSALRATPPIDVQALRHAWRAVAGQHEALRIDRVRARGWSAGDAPAPFISLDGGLDALERELARPVDPQAGPFQRLICATEPDGSQLVCLVLHRLVGDGWSLGVVWQALMAQLRADPAASRAPGPDPRRATGWLRMRRATAGASVAPWPWAPAAPGPYPARLDSDALSGAADRLAERAATMGLSPLAVLLDAVAEAAAHGAESAHGPLTVAVPIAGQPLMSLPCLVSHTTRLAAIDLATPWDGDGDRAAHLHRQVVDALDGHFADVAVSTTGQRGPSVVVNLDRAPPLALPGTQLSPASPTPAWTSWPLVVNITAAGSDLHVTWKFAADDAVEAAVSALRRALCRRLCEEPS